jgi:hypothetical protein
MRTDSVNIVHWNCQGFNAHGPEYIWSLSKQKHIPDIICLQETFFLNEKDHPDITGFIFDMNALEIIKNIQVENSSTGFNTVLSTWLVYFRH